MVKTQTKVPKTYNPGPGFPKEEAIYVNKAELPVIKFALKNQGHITKHGVRSFVDPSGAYGGDMSGTQTASNNNGSGTPSGGSSGPGAGLGPGGGGIGGGQSPNSGGGSGGGSNGGGGGYYGGGGSPSVGAHTTGSGGGYGVGAGGGISQNTGNKSSNTSQSPNNPTQGLGSNQSPTTGLAAALSAGLGIPSIQNQQAPVPTFSQSPDTSMFREPRANVHVSDVGMIPNAVPLNTGLPTPEVPNGPTPAQAMVQQYSQYQQPPGFQTPSYDAYNPDPKYQNNSNTYAGPKGTTELNHEARFAVANAANFHPAPVQRTPGDAEMMGRMAMAESQAIKNPQGAVSTPALQATMDVMRNRALSAAFPNTIPGVLNQRKQFSPMQDGTFAATPANYSATAVANGVLNGEVPSVVGNALNYANTTYLGTPKGIADSSAATRKAFSSMKVDASFSDASNPGIMHSFGTIGAPSDVSLSSSNVRTPSTKVANASPSVAQNTDTPLGPKVSMAPGYVGSKSAITPMSAPGYAGSMSAQAPSVAPGYIGSRSATTPMATPGYAGSMSAQAPQATPGYAGSMSAQTPLGPPGYANSTSAQTPSGPPGYANSTSAQTPLGPPGYANSTSAIAPPVSVGPMATKNPVSGGFGITAFGQGTVTAAQVARMTKDPTWAGKAITQIAKTDPKSIIDASPKLQQVAAQSPTFMGRLMKELGMGGKKGTEAANTLTAMLTGGGGHDNGSFGDNLHTSDTKKSQTPMSLDAIFAALAKGTDPYKVQSLGFA